MSGNDPPNEKSNKKIVNYVVPCTESATSQPKTCKQLNRFTECACRASRAVCGRGRHRGFVHARSVYRCKEREQGGCIY